VLEFKLENAFNYDFSKLKIDFVHWNNSLHHMFDVSEAIKWSYEILSPGGVFYMDDYVGSTRFQYPEYVLDIVNGIRNNLPKKYLKDQFNDGIYHGHVAKIDQYELEKNDPSEAADSERIINSVKKYFPSAEIILTGGIIYFIALNGLWGNFDEENENDISILTKLMGIDKQYAQQQNIMSPYAVALAFK
jgi:SAM-dependent methyltransferase